MIRNFEDGVTIRPFTSEDRALVLEFTGQFGGETRAFFDYNGGNSGLAMSFFEDNGKRWAKNYTPFLAEKDGIMVGYVFLWDVQDRISALGICVREGCKGLHLGERLISYALDYARSIGCNAVWLTTHIGNLRGQTLYAKMGFQKLGIGTAGEWFFVHPFEKAEPHTLPEQKMLSNDILLRPAASEDRGKTEAFYAKLGAQSRVYVAQGGYIRQAMDRFDGKAGDTTLFLAEKNGEVVGCVCVSGMNKTVPWLTICIADEYQGKHLGMECMGHVHQWLEDCGYAGVLLKTHLANARAQALFHHMKYTYRGISLGGESLWMMSFENERFGK